MKVLVAGGAGYIGSVLVPLLQAHGHTVHVVDLCWFGNHLPAETVVTRKDLFKLTEADLDGFDRVVFLAGLSNDPMAEYDPAQNFIENAALPAYLAYRAKQAGVPRFIYSSSCSLYGFAADELYDEHSPTTCAYPYGVSKFQGEQGVMQFRGDGFSTIALRLGTACGYSPRPRFDLIVNTMFKCALQDGAIVINNPDIWRPIVDVRDVSAGFALAIEADEGLNGIFNIAYGNYTVKQVGEQVQARVQHLTGREVTLTIHQNIDFRNYRVTCDKAKTVLGFEPRHNVDSIVDRLYEHLDEYGDFSDDALYNIRVFKKLTW